jgi:protein TonB
MFHYRLAPANNRSRMIIATLLAISLHIGLMNFKFPPKPVFVPSVSLPRSVSVFLNQKNMVEIPIQQIEKKQIIKHLIEEQPATETVQEKPLPQALPAIKENTDTPLQQPAPLEKTVKQSAIEEVVPAAQESENIAEDLMPDPVNAAKAQVSVAPAETKAEQGNDGVSLPGTLQMAYPRYQLNAPPPYPGLARKRGQEGTVILQVFVNSEGRVDDLKIETPSGFAMLDRAAIKAVRKWRFEPGRRGKVKISMRVRVPVTFKLKK